MIARATTGALALCLACSAAHPADPAPLRSNPFERPASATVVPAVGTAEAPIAVGDSIELRATMVGDHTALADVGGRILRPGDVIDEFELVAVSEDRATFRYRDRTVTVRVKPTLDGSDE